MPENDGRAAAGAVGRLVPGHVTRRRIRKPELVTEVHGPVGSNEPHSRHCVDDDAQAVVASEIVAPARGPIAVEVADQLAVARSAQRSLGLAREFQRMANAPLRKQAGVNHSVTTFYVHHVLPPQPIDELLPVGRLQYVTKGVARMPLVRTFCHNQQRQIVIAKHSDRAFAQPLHEAHGRKRVRATIDQIADEPQPIVALVVAAALEQPHQRVVAALDVTDCVSRHCKRACCELPQIHHSHGTTPKHTGIPSAVWRASRSRSSSVCFLVIPWSTIFLVDGDLRTNLGVTRDR